MLILETNTLIVPSEGRNTGSSALCYIHAAWGVNTMGELNLACPGGPSPNNVLGKVDRRAIAKILLFSARGFIGKIDELKAPTTYHRSFNEDAALTGSSGLGETSNLLYIISLGSQATKARRSDAVRLYWCLCIC